MAVDVLVYGANGLVGQALVHELLHAGLGVRALVRDVTKASALEQSGAQVVSAALEDREALARAHRGVEVVLLQLPAGLDAAAMRGLAAAAISTIRQAGVEKVVYNAAVQLPRRAAELPAIAATASIEDELRRNQLSCTVIRPTFLLQNLLLPWVTQSIVSRASLVYPIDSGRKLSWVAAEDVGRLAAAVVRQETYGHSLEVGARQAIDGDELAQRFSKGLNRHVEFVSLPVDQWETQVDALLGAGAGRRIGAIFRFIQQHPDDLDFVAQTFSPPSFLPEHEPMPPEDWVHAHRSAYAAG